MERILVVVFDNEKKSYEGKSALRQLEIEGNVTVYAEAVVVKHADGTITVKEQNDFGPVGTLLGTSLGTVVGALGGPVGLAIGAATGATLGGLADLDNLFLGDEFLAEVSQSLTPNKVALVAEVEEEWTTPVDIRMESLGGSVFRRAAWEVEETLRDKDTAAMKADLAQYKQEIKSVNAERRAKIQKKVDGLEARIAKQEAKAQKRHQEFEARQKTKKELLKKNAAAAGRTLKTLANTPV